MAIAQAKCMNLPIAPRKARLVANMIRGRSVADARDLLQFTNKLTALPMRKLVDSAAANAEHAARERHERMSADDMVIVEIMVNEGRTLHRWLSGPRGRASRIRKRSCHIELTIADV